MLLANPDQRPYKQWQHWQQREGQQREEDKDTDKGDKDKEYKAREWEPGVGAIRPYQGADVRYKDSKTPINEVAYLKHHPGGFHQSSSSSDPDPKMKGL